MTFNIGDKVRVNASYTLDNFTEEDKHNLLTEAGTIIGVTGAFLSVELDNGYHAESTPKLPWLFLPEELDPLEEAHPLTNEFAKSPETASENNSDGAPFKVGDLVKVVNYHPVWDGTVGKVHEVYNNRHANIRNTTHSEFGLGFPFTNLELVGKAF